MRLIFEVNFEGQFWRSILEVNFGGQFLGHFLENLLVRCCKDAMSSGQDKFLINNNTSAKWASWCNQKTLPRIFAICRHLLAAQNSRRNWIEIREIGHFAFIAPIFVLIWFFIYGGLGGDLGRNDRLFSAIWNVSPFGFVRFFVRIAGVALALCFAWARTLKAQKLKNNQKNRFFFENFDLVCWKF